MEHGSSTPSAIPSPRFEEKKIFFFENKEKAGYAASDSPAKSANPISNGQHNETGGDPTAHGVGQWKMVKWHLLPIVLKTSIT